MSDEAELFAIIKKRTTSLPPKPSAGVLIRDQADRDAIASQLLRYRDERGDDSAAIIDMLTMHPEARSSSHLVSLR